MSETFSRSSDAGVEADRKVRSTHDSSASSSPFWTLQIKPVGEESDFSITLHPDDDILQLYQQVASRTGVPQEEQRLIYRGRLIPNALPKQDDDDGATGSNKEGASVSKSSPHQQKIKDIVGLTNGHSIHFVRRTQKQKDEEEENELTTEDEATRVVLDPASNTTSSSSATSSLLSALLGGSSQRRMAHRLREEDWVRPDPGSMETVRQGLLTLHTLQSSSERRNFYRGQWIDCRDTVNMWLEATVVDILCPQDIIQSYNVTSSERASSTSRNSAVLPTSDPPIAVTDLEGRRRLLLEPCADPADAVECMDGVYYRLRSNNDGVQILHVHYNGWPVRWDEWIRSDSERIRPFRVRTLHDASSASPNVEAVMPNAPTTFFTANEDEPSDRRALLPELHRVLGAVQTRLESVVTSTSAATNTAAPNSSHPLPWLPVETGESQTRLSRRQQQQALEQLAPFLDRLGRTLVDAAPHVLALADAMGQESDDAEEEEEEPDPSPPPSTLGGLLSLLSVRDRGNRHGSVASSNAAVPSVVSDVEVSLASSATGEPAAHADEEEEEIEEEEDEEAAATSVDPDLRDFSTGIVNTTRGDARNRSRSSDDTTASLLGAYLAAMSLSDSGSGVTEGLGRLLRGNGSGGIDIHIHAVVTAPGLEGAIGLAALTGGTAIPVATPVVNAATTNTSPSGGLSGLFGGGSPRESSRRGASARRTRTTTTDNSLIPPSFDAPPEDDSDLFAELYSETPEPINPNRSSSSTPTHSPSSTTPSVRSVERSVSSSGASFGRSRSRSRSMRRMLPQNLHASFNNGSGGGESSSNADMLQSSDVSLSSSQRNGSNSGLLRRFFRRSEGGA